jgi:hypothetical protein
VLKGRDFTACGKTHSGSTPGFIPLHSFNSVSSASQAAEKLIGAAISNAL